MTDLREFLRARVAEDEAVARGVIDGTTLDMAEELPIGCWSERRVLAECEAKRAIIDLHPRCRPDSPDTHCVCECEWSGCSEGECQTLRALALPYADHPDYLDEWRP
jgi:hypothetical protein